jgi:Ion channel
MAAWVVAGIVVYVYIERKAPSPKRGIVKIGVSYAVLMGVNAHVYQFLYRGDNSRFVFAQDLQARKKEEASRMAAERQVDIEKQLRNLQGGLDSIMEISKKVTIGDAQISQDGNDLRVQTEKYLSFFSFQPGVQTKKSNPIHGHWTLSYGSQGYISDLPFDLQGPVRRPGESESAWEQRVNEYYPPKINLAARIGEINASARSTIGKKMDDLRRTLPIAPDEQWTYVDFLYFSVITQTTVGYGDILPNSTIVRAVVMFQVLAGLCLLGVGLSWVATPTNSPSVKPALTDSPPDLSR